MANRLCHDFSRNGKCKFGARCKFSHGNPAPTSGASSSVARGGSSHPSATRTSAPRVANSNNQPAAANAPPCPPGVCRGFWVAGSCQFGNKCRYRHQYYADSAADDAEGDDEPEPMATISSNAVPGTGADAFIVGDDAQQSAGDALTTLSKRYFRDDYRFEKAAFVYSFMSILSSATRSNKLWVSAVIPRYCLQRLTGV
jgi:hypothetical protein